MPAVINVGGSLTGAFAVIAVAWGVRTLRTVSLKRKAKAEEGGSTFSDLGAYFASLSPEAVRLLLDTDPTAHYAFDVRPVEQAEEQPLPSELSMALPVPEEELSEVLSQPRAWQERFGPERVAPTHEHLLLFLADSEERMRHAAGLAASLGYPRTAILEGGLGSFAHPATNSNTPPFISRDGLSVLLGRSGSADEASAAVELPRATVLDLRRHDERTLYGSIPGTMHLPVDQFASALALAPEAFRDAYHFDKPHQEELLVLQCRTNRRSTWAATLARDAGWDRVVVYKEGSFGWRYDASVKAYPSYEPWEAPPEPEAFTPDQPDVAAGLQEIERLGLGRTSAGGNSSESGVPGSR